MTLTTLDVALPIALGALFGAARYQTHLRMAAPDPMARALRDAVMGAAGLAVITLGYQYLTTT
jgi:hypothetical protein